MIPIKLGYMAKYTMSFCFVSFYYFFVSFPCSKASILTLRTKVDKGGY